MIDPALRDLIDQAGRPTAALDVGALRRRVRRRRRRRAAGQAVASLTAVAVLLLGAQALVRVGDDAPVELAGAGDRLVRVDPDVDVVDGLAALPDGVRAAQPTRLPDGYRRCSAAITTGEVTTTRYCAEDRPPLSLAHGPHHALPEVGDPHEVSRRVGYVHRRDGLVAITVSDGNGAADRHHRLSVEEDADIPLTDLLGVLASIPAVAEAPPPSGG